MITNVPLVIKNCGKAWNLFHSYKKPKEILKITKELEINDYFIGRILGLKDFKKRKVISSSKFFSLERKNWGAPSGARKLILGEYFTKMRLYRLDQPIVAQYLTLLRKSKNISIKEIINKFPKEYRHTVGHWFREDFGGSIPVPEDVKILRKVLNSNDSFMKALEKTALKFQTVKNSIKGKNPGDFIENKDEKMVIKYLMILYSPTNIFLKFYYKDKI